MNQWPKQTFIGILIDESTDISTSKNLIIYMYVHLAANGGISTYFLKMIELNEGVQLGKQFLMKSLKP